VQSAHGTIIITFKIKYKTGLLQIYEFIKRFRNIAEIDYYICHVCPSVCPHRATRLTLDGFFSKFIFEYSSKN